jgi:hypothetical protein
MHSLCGGETGNMAAAQPFCAPMSITSSLLVAATIVSFRGYVPPHAAADGLRYQVVAQAGLDLSAAMQGCGITDRARLGLNGGEQAYQFAVTRDTEASVRCLRARLPGEARLQPIDHWIPNAQAD